MISAAMLFMPKPSGAKGVADSGSPRADDRAAGDFAAMLGSLLQSNVTVAASKSRVGLDGIADAALDGEPITDGKELTDESERSTSTTDGAPALSDGGLTAGASNAAIAATAAAASTGMGTGTTESTRTSAWSGTEETVANSETTASTATTDEIPVSDASATGTMTRTMTRTTPRDADNDTTRTTTTHNARRSSRAAAAERVETATSTLDPEFAARLTRVLDRMREAGHEVEITETVRSSERQHALFAQGRTTVGAVVTWTLDSRHLDGHAADLRVDGRTTGDAYALLQRIATEEGLRTLGTRDPGHVEMSETNGDVSESAASRRGAGMAPAAAGRNAIASVALEAVPAAVARVARVATTAHVAIPGAITKGTFRTRPTTSASTGTLVAATAAKSGTSPNVASLLSSVEAAGTNTARTAQSATAAADAPETAVATVPAETTTKDQGASNQEGTRSDALAQASRAARAAEEESEGVRTMHPARGRALSGPATADRDAGTIPVVGSARMHATRSGTGGTAAAISYSGTLAAERVAELLAARDALPARTVGELRLALDPLRDGLSEVHLAMDGATLDATLRTNDAGIARGLQGEIATLTRSLERQGFDAARVSIALDAAQHARATERETVTASGATARERALRGDSDASREGRDQHTANDTRREQQHARQFGSRRQRLF